MKSSAQQTKAAAKLLADTGSASMAVVGSRMLSPKPGQSCRPANRELATMVSEKVESSVASGGRAARPDDAYRLFGSARPTCSPRRCARMFTTPRRFDGRGMPH